MKKYVVFGLMLSLGWTSFGQKWKVTPEAGINVLAVEKDTFGTDYKPTFNGGITGSYNFTESFGIRTGVFFTRKAHTITGADTSQVNLFGLEEAIPQLESVDLSIFEESKTRTTQTYLEFPVLATYKFRQFNFYAGPYFSYMLSANSVTQTFTRIPALQAFDVSSIDSTGFISAFLPPAYDEDISKSNSVSGLNTIDVGFKAGFGLEVDNIGLNAYYNYGFLNFRTSNPGRITNYHYLQLSLSYSFGF